MEATGINNPNPPNLLTFSGEWQDYEDSLYKVFLDSVVNGNLSFQGLPIRAKREPEYKGKGFTFWHLISEGKKEEERIPDLRRCERVAWISWVISNCDKIQEISYWPNKRKPQKHFVIWFNETHRYAVVLAERNGYFLLKSHYLINNHRLKTFRLERSTSKKK